MVATIYPSDASADFASLADDLGNGRQHMVFAVENVGCAGCMARIERELGKLSGVETARLNFTTHRLAVTWDGAHQSPVDLMRRLADLGFPAHPFDPGIAKQAVDREGRALLMALAVAGFGMMNIMLLSVSVWAGAVTDMDELTRHLFHWFSALIGLPVIAWSGQPFFRSAIRALNARSLNMDVPISLGVLTAGGLSLWETATGGHAVYFDSAVMLLFFLLIGRTLDHLMRARVRSHAENLATLQATTVNLEQDGGVVSVPVSAVNLGSIVRVSPGARIPVDGVVIDGSSEVDRGLITGETLPEPAAIGTAVYAGTINGSGLLSVRVTAEAESSFLSTVNQLLNAATEARSRYVVLADRAARIYAPVVHLTALCVLIGWLIAGAGFHQAALIAVAVLIITCPCALGLAIPAVQAVACGYLFRRGILLNSADAIERLATVDTVVFDKTGTLTKPNADVVGAEALPDDLATALATLAETSAHPLAAPVARVAPANADLTNVREHKGLGLEADRDGQTVRLGSPAFCGVEAEAERFSERAPHLSVICGRLGDATGVLGVGQQLRDDARDVVATLKLRGYRVMILSGDRPGPVQWAGKQLGVEDPVATADPAMKTELLEQLKKAGHKPLMVGDGLNDAAALASATVSLSPVSAADLTKATADGFFLGEDLHPVLTALRLGRAAKAAMMQNIGLAASYNVVAVPLAVLGFVTPLVAALAMSGSSLVVTVNALRLRWLRDR